MVTDYPTIRDTVLDARNRDNRLRWMDAWARGDTPRDLRTWREQDAACDLHARAASLRSKARAMHDRRFGVLHFRRLRSVK